MQSNSWIARGDLLFHIAQETQLHPTTEHSGLNASLCLSVCILYFTRLLIEPLRCWRIRNSCGKMNPYFKNWYLCNIYQFISLISNLSSLYSWMSKENLSVEIDNKNKPKSISSERMSLFIQGNTNPSDSNSNVRYSTEWREYRTLSY